jgi:hypothetical protein
MLLPIQVSLNINGTNETKRLRDETVGDETVGDETVTGRNDQCARSTFPTACIDKLENIASEIQNEHKHISAINIYNFTLVALSKYQLPAFRGFCMRFVSVRIKYIFMMFLYLYLYAVLKLRMLSLNMCFSLKYPSCNEVSRIVQHMGSEQPPPQALLIN